MRGDDFVQALTGLFRDIGSALDANRDAVVETFGATAMLDVATALQAECDTYGSRVLRSYCQHRRLGALMQQTNALQSPEKGLGSSAATSTTAAATAAAAVDPRQVEEYLDEVLVLAQLCDEYNQYVLAAMSEATAPESLGAARENSFRSGAFNQTVRELVSYYIQMVRTEIVFFIFLKECGLRGEGGREGGREGERRKWKRARSVGKGKDFACRFLLAPSDPFHLAAHPLCFVDPKNSSRTRGFPPLPGGSREHADDPWGDGRPRKKSWGGDSSESLGFLLLETRVKQDERRERERASERKNTSNKMRRRPRSSAALLSFFAPLRRINIRGPDATQYLHSHR